tara:strand:+ start:14238 stop:14660 length:423 start_codon:yes stop_codon:yes gene_type:complete
MASPSAAERVYYRVEYDLEGEAAGDSLFAGLPLKGLIRRVRAISSEEATSVVLTFTEAPLVSTIDLDLVMVTRRLTTPADLIGDTLYDAQAIPAVGGQGVPFQLTPSSPGSTTGSLYFAWSGFVAGADAIIQLTIEPLVP